MTPTSHPIPAEESRMLHLLLVLAVLQAVVAACAFWALGLFLVAAQSDLLRDLVTVCTSVATAILRVGLHLLGV